MSNRNPTDPTERDDDTSPFAPKWVRDPSRSDRLAAGEFSERSDESPRKDSDMRRPLEIPDTRGLARPARVHRPPADGEPPEHTEQSSRDEDPPQMRRP